MLLFIEHIIKIFKKCAGNPTHLVQLGLTLGWLASRQADEIWVNFEFVKFKFLNSSLQLTK